MARSVTNVISTDSPTVWEWLRRHFLDSNGRVTFDRFGVMPKQLDNTDRYVEIVYDEDFVRRFVGGQEAVQCASQWKLKRGEYWRTCGDTAVLRAMSMVAAGKRMEKYGAINWHYWQLANWGCSGTVGTLGVYDASKALVFYTEDSPPYKIREKAAEKLSVDLGQEASLRWVCLYSDCVLEEGLLSGGTVTINEVKENEDA